MADIYIKSWQKWNRHNNFVVEPKSREYFLLFHMKISNKTTYFMHIYEQCLLKKKKKKYFFRHHSLFLSRFTFTKLLPVATPPFWHWRNILSFNNYFQNLLRVMYRVRHQTMRSIFRDDVPQTL